ncbi:hypothetical protein HN51_050665, partial [Arachis hypogaea]
MMITHGGSALSSGVKQQVKLEKENELRIEYGATIKMEGSLDLVSTLYIDCADETREEVTVTERGREQISRASSSPTIEKTRRPPSESRASSSSPPPPSLLPRHPVHHLWLVLRYAILNLEVIQAAISLAKQEGLLVSLDLASFE